MHLPSRCLHPTSDNTGTEAIELLRGFVERVIRHRASEHDPEIEFVGDMAGMIEIAMPQNETAAQERAAVSEVFRRSVKFGCGDPQPTQIAALGRRMMKG